MKNLTMFDEVDNEVVVSKKIVCESGFEGQNFGDVNTYTASGAIALTDKFAILDGTSAAVAATLAAGTAGQVIYVKCINIANTVTLAPTLFHDGALITFDPADEYCVLMSDGTNWYFVGGDAAIT